MLRAARDRLLGVNCAGVAVDFGGVKTDGSFRLAHPAAGAWTLTPLPDSDGFKAEIDLAAFGAAGASVDALEPTEGAAPPTWHQDGNVLTLVADARAFAYRITFKK